MATSKTIALAAASTITASATSIVAVLDYIRENEVGELSVQDAIFKFGNVQSYPQFVSMRTGFQSRLRAGGSHHELLGTKIFPSPHTSGKKPLWCGAVESRENKIDIDPTTKRVPDSKWLTAPDVTKATDSLALLGQNSAENMAKVIQLAKSGSRAFNASFGLINDLAAKATSLKNANAALAEDNKKLRSQSDEKIRAMLERDYGLTPKSSDNDSGDAAAAAA